jgi:hypothetical protein
MVVATSYSETYNSPDYPDDATGVRADDYGMAIDHSATASILPCEDGDVVGNNLAGHDHA